MPSQEHIFTQLEWYLKLMDEYGCTEVELEHSLEDGYIVDVWGHNKEKDIMYIVEIGSCSKYKRAYLELLSDNVKIMFVNINKAYAFPKKKKKEEKKYIPNPYMLHVSREFWGKVLEKMHY